MLVNTLCILIMITILTACNNNQKHIENFYVSIEESSIHLQFSDNSYVLGGDYFDYIEFCELDIKHCMVKPFLYLETNSSHSKQFELYEVNDKTVFKTILYTDVSIKECDIYIDKIVTFAEQNTVHTYFENKILGVIKISIQSSPSPAQTWISCMGGMRFD